MAPTPSPAALGQETAGETLNLDRLRGLRTAPTLSLEQRQQLKRELAQALARCQWFTVGVMAPGEAEALAALRALELAQDWSALAAASEPVVAVAPGHSVFLKGNQRTGTYLLRQEDGLGEGLLITGHHSEDPSVEGTWGPLPLDLFAA
ncbi:MAG: DUF1824 family protein [Cyanobacteria bacterium]|nr:DUF1824 family protein [Cyanobacteriota bacterium]